MALGKHAVKVLTVFAVLFVLGFLLKFLNLQEGFTANFNYNNKNRMNEPFTQIGPVKIKNEVLNNQNNQNN